jgi:hypothetical protein
VVRRRITYANTMATLAVFIALGGSSYAALKVTGKNVKDESLTGADIRNGSLKSKDIDNRSLRAIDFKRRALRPGREGRPGSDGFDGFDGADGADGATGAGITLASGRADGIASDAAPATFFGSPSGAGPAAANEGDAQVLSPAEATTASDLSVAFTRPPCADNLTQSGCGEPGSATVTLRVDNADTEVACTVSTVDPVCNSAAATVEIHAGARLSLKITGALADANDDRDVLFGLALRPAD